MRAEKNLTSASECAGMLVTITVVSTTFRGRVCIARLLVGALGMKCPLSDPANQWREQPQVYAHRLEGWQRHVPPDHTQFRAVHEIRWQRTMSDACAAERVRQTYRYCRSPTGSCGTVALASENRSSRRTADRMLCHQSDVFLPTR